MFCKKYTQSDHLQKKIFLHEQYSENEQGFGEWIYSHYDIEPSSKSLELRCETSEMWVNKLNLLDHLGHLILSDFSTGMLETARKNIGEHQHIR